MPDRRRALALLAAAPALGLAGCAGGGGLPPLPPDPGPYRLGPGDQVQLRVFEQDGLSGVYTVADDGTIAVPLAGTLPAAGLTPAALADALAARLRARDIMNAPAVAAEVSSYRPFYILGEVARPGAYPYRPGMSVLSAISLAGGFTDRARQAYQGITRRDGGSTVQYRATPDALPEPGDVITVFERRF